MPALPDHFAVTDEATAEKPFRLVAAPARTFLNSTFTETPSSLAREKRPTALLHPDDCAALGAVAGTAVQLGNERGVVIAHAEPAKASRAAWSSSRGSGRTSTSSTGSASMRLTSAEPGYPNGGAVFHDTAVWIRRVDLDGTAGYNRPHYRHAATALTRRAQEPASPLGGLGWVHVRRSPLTAVRGFAARRLDTPGSHPARTWSPTGPPCRMRGGA